MSNTHSFIVFEGLDGAGTTTQTRLLHDCFTRSGRRCSATREPTDGPIGSLVRGALSQGGMSERVLALLFAADRLRHTVEIQEKLAAETRVVCDRYVLSSMAYQTLDPGISADWVAAINNGCARPDVTIFLDVPVGVCLARIGARGEEETIYERRELLEQIDRNYRRLSDTYERHFGPLVRIDGTRDPNAVAMSALAVLEKY